MIQLEEYNPWADIGGEFGKGISKGVSSSQEFANKMRMEKANAQQEFDIFKKYFQKSGNGITKPTEGMGDQLSNDYTNNTEEQPTPDQEEFEEAWLDYKFPKVMEGRREKEKMKSKLELSAEPKLLEMEDKLEAQEHSGMKFERLSQLFSPELEDQFPPALMAAAFTKEGELTPLAQASLSPDAQEAVKLITDEIKGARETFGARVTNFEANTYLKTLPNLLNTPEGRRRVLRDLKIVNKLNRMEGEGVLNIIDKYGGPGKISISKAKRMYKKQNASKIAEMKQEFINPEKANFSEMPDASMYMGRELEDPETGQIFVSDGKEWVPQE
jgi:hypothetical protein